MATILDDEDKNAQNATGSNGEVVLSNESGTIGNGAAGGGATTTPAGTTQQPGGGFTNLQQYVTANQGNDTQMGQKVQQNVAQNAQVADQKVQGYQTGADQRVDQGTIGLDNTVQSAIKSSPEKIIGDPSLKAAFDKQYNAQFTGATQAADYDGYNDAQEQALKVERQGKAAAGDNADRRGLLNDVYARPDYGSGQQNLDSFILGAGEGGQQALQQINQNYGQYGQKATGAADEVNSRIQNALKTSQTTRDTTRGLVSSQASGYDQNFRKLSETVQREAQEQQKQYQATLDGLKSGNAKVRASTFKSIGLDPQVGEFLVNEGYDPSQLIAAGKAKSLGDVANAQDVARYQALQQLQQKGSDYDFTAAGGDGRAYTVDSERAKAAQGAQSLLSQIQKQLDAQNRARQDEYGTIAGGLTSFKDEDRQRALRMLGLNADDDALVRQYGTGDAFDYLSSAGKLDYGNVASSQQQQQFAKLLNTLGIKGKENLSAKNKAAASSYNFDTAKWNAAVAAAKQKAAEAAAAAAQPSSYDAGVYSPSYTPDAHPMGDNGEGKGVQQQAVEGANEAVDEGTKALDKATGGYGGKIKKHKW